MSSKCPESMIFASWRDQNLTACRWTSHTIWAPPTGCMMLSIIIFKAYRHFLLFSSYMDCQRDFVLFFPSFLASTWWDGSPLGFYRIWERAGGRGRCPYRFFHESNHGRNRMECFDFGSNLKTYDFSKGRDSCRTRKRLSQHPWCKSLLGQSPSSLFPSLRADIFLYIFWPGFREWWTSSADFRIPSTFADGFLKSHEQREISIDSPHHGGQGHRQNLSLAFRGKIWDGLHLCKVWW